ncbi:MAG: hypothetical protein V4508_07950 [Pseudomonadota bacterium]
MNRRWIGLLFCLALPAAARASDDLRRLAACPFGPQLNAVSVDRLANRASWRTVKTSSGTMRVSVADGYRVMLAFPDSGPFVNLKLERSAPGRFGADRAAILAQMTSFAASPNAPVTPFQVVVRNGVELMMLESASIGAGGPIGMYTFVSEHAGVVATAYLLNQKPGRRKFQTLQQYRQLRDGFITALSGCMQQLPTDSAQNEADRDTPLHAGKAHAG